ncbi:MAG: hypothetical protein PWP51_755 [Clostridiales bacterium]|nr:hypothetical protein [Clostridiales bacterium]MDN5298202.1 hypothetical protein [Clostridiales bacterium]
MNRLNMQINFINEIEKLKTVKRQNLTLDNQRQENSAEHSWHLVEIYDGDTFLFDEKTRLEASKKEVAKFARSLDALQPVLNYLITAPENCNPYDLKAEDVIKKKAFIQQHTPKLWSVVEDAISESIKKGLYIK